MLNNVKLLIAFKKYLIHQRLQILNYLSRKIMDEEYLDDMALEPEDDMVLEPENVDLNGTESDDTDVNEDSMLLQPNSQVLVKKR